MIFVPLPLFATFGLLIALIAMIQSRDMAVRTNQLFAGLVGFYALQSLLLCLRWGYEIDAVAPFIAMLAPVLPVVACLAYLSLMQRRAVWRYWPLSVIALNWAALFLARDLADAVILLTYMGFGFFILQRARAGGDDMALVRLEQASGAWLAMVLTGAGLIVSAFVDVFVVYDFMTTGGQNIGLTITMMQEALLLCIGLAAFASQSGAVEGQASDEVLPDAMPTDEDDAIMARLTRLFSQDALHTDTDLNLRRMARKLGLPDRSVSQAINRTQGKSVSQFVNGFRISDACKLLEQTDQSILQGSLAAGFITKSNFNREFVRVTGQTPSP